MKHIRFAFYILATLALFAAPLAPFFAPLGPAAAADLYPANPANGHIYGFVASPGIPWADAEALAEEMVIEGCSAGYLATITSQAENVFLYEQFGAGYWNAWLGGYQDPTLGPPDANWKWVTGEPWEYTNWALNEPNDDGGAEQHLMMLNNTPENAGMWNDGETLAHIFGYFIECDYVDVQIDIKPGSEPNAFNANGHGVIPVAMLGSADLDVTAIDPATLLLAGAPVRVKGNGDPQCALEDVSSPPDGIPDLVCQFVDSFATGWPSGETVATLTGRLSDGTAITGGDSIVIVP